LLTFSLALFAKIRKVATSDLFSLTALALTLDLILFNKVGSPQYLGWLIVPIMIGLSYRVCGWWPAIVGVLMATAMTQVIYPNVYDDLRTAHLLPVILLTVRNAIEVAIFAWTIWRLAQLAFKKQTQETSHDLILD
jgi:thiamine transporter ThiT